MKKKQSSVQRTLLASNQNEAIPPIANHVKERSLQNNILSERKIDVKSLSICDTKTEKKKAIAYRC